MARRNGPGLPDEVVHGTSPSASPVRITVALAAKAIADLRRTVERTQLSQTDAVNRAVSLYEFVDSELSQGAEFILRRDGRDFLVKLL